MKVGFIVECVDEGPETKVIPRLASLVNPATESEVEPLGSKPKVLTDCGRYAKALFENSKCDRVIVIWDARPYWDDDLERNLTISEQRDKASLSLKGKGLAEDSRVTLICIIEELEAWLLADGRGVTHRINQLLRTRPKLKKPIPHAKDVERIDWPKSKMEKLFETNKVRAYTDWVDAGHIAEGIPNSGRLLKHSVFFPDFAAAVSI